MNSHLRANLLLLGLTLLFCSILYPLTLLAVGQAIFPFEADGSLVVAEGEAAGSRLIGQDFKGPQWFHPRPSHAGTGYDAAASAGSNWAASNPQLRQRAARLVEEHAPTEGETVPADAVTASGSGLDPHISLKNARRQVDRIVTAWASKPGTDSLRVRAIVEEILDRHAHAPLGGLAGDPIVNVLEVNLALRGCEELAPRSE